MYEAAAYDKFACFCKEQAQIIINTIMIMIIIMTIIIIIIMIVIIAIIIMIIIMIIIIRGRASRGADSGRGDRGGGPLAPPARFFNGLSARRFWACAIARARAPETRLCANRAPPHICI